MVMHSLKLIIIFRCIFIAMSELDKCFMNDMLFNGKVTNFENYERKKRSLIYPEGSSVVLTLQLLKALQLKEPSPINLLFELDVLWKIPNESKLLIKNPVRLHRRHRRELYTNIELAFNSQKLPGKACVLRSICEAKFILNPEGISFVDDVLRVILRYPNDAKSKMDEYDIAFQNNGNCESLYPCPTSFLSILLNYDLIINK